MKANKYAVLVIVLALLLILVVIVVYDHRIKALNTHTAVGPPP